MKVVSLGFTCYLKSLLQLTIYASETDFFDWMNTFYFKSLIKCIEDGGAIFDFIEKSNMDVDKKTNNLYNPVYDFRLPHDTLNSETIVKYKRRFERFQSYKTTNTKCTFIRIMNVEERYGKPPESLAESYSKEVYEKLMTFVPITSKILLITHNKLSIEEKNSIYEKFIVLDNVLNPEYCFFGNHMKHTNKIVKYYTNLFNYIDKNFDSITPSSTKQLQQFISNDTVFS